MQRAGIFQIELEVPDGYEVRSVQGAHAAGASAVTVDSHHLEDVEYVPNPGQPDVKAKKRRLKKLFYSAAEVGEILGLSQSLIYQLASGEKPEIGSIRAGKPGCRGVYRFTLLPAGTMPGPLPPMGSMTMSITKNHGFARRTVRFSGPVWGDVGS